MDDLHNIHKVEAAIELLEENGNKMSDLMLHSYYGGVSLEIVAHILRLYRDRQRGVVGEEPTVGELMEGTEPPMYSTGTEKAEMIRTMESVLYCLGVDAG